MESGGWNSAWELWVVSEPPAQHEHGMQSTNNAMPIFYIYIYIYL